MLQPYRLVTLGGLRLERAQGGVVTGAAAQQRALAVLAAVAVAGVRGISRDWLIALLWPESEEERARHVLAQLLYNLRRGLEPQSPIAVAGRQLWLDLAVVHADVRAFEDALRDGDDARALRAYGGAFLDGVYLAGAPGTFEEWVERERARLAALYRAALGREAARLTSAGDAASAAVLRQRLVDADPLDTPATLGLMEALASAGDAGSAIEAARRHGALRRDQLDAPPVPAVEELAERIRRATEAQAAAAHATRPTPAPTTTPAADLPPATAPTVDVARDDPVAAPSRAPVLARRRRLTMLAAAIVVSVGALLVARWRSDAAASSPPPPRSIVVLPFANLGGDSTDDFLGAGIAEDVRLALAHVPSLQVVSRGERLDRDRDPDPRAAGRRFGVASVVEGTVRRAGDRVRVVVRLVDAGTGYVRWSASYDRAAADVMALQAAIAEQIAAALRVTLVPQRYATDPQTYELFMRGRYFWQTLTEPGMRRGLAYLEQAIARDSTFAPAYVGLADAWLQLSAYHDVPPVDAASRARAAVERALSLDSTLADAHATLGYLDTFHDWRFVEAEREFRRAITLDPRHARAHLWYAWYLSAMGRHDEAQREVRAVRDFEPLWPLAAARLATMAYFAGDAAAALRESRMALELDSTFWVSHRQLGEALVQLGRAEEGVVEVRRALAIAPSAETRARLATALAHAGRAGEARAMLDSLTREAERQYVSPTELARVHLALGDTASAYAALDRALAARASGIVLVGTDPDFAPLRDAPRFRRLMAAVGLPAR